MTAKSEQLSTQGSMGKEGGHYGNHFPKEIIRESEWYYTETLVEHIYVTRKKADIRELRIKRQKIYTKKKCQR